MNSKGFTLIELLVVIAIIGILAAVVVASLGSAQSKGNDAGILANVDTVVTQAGLYQSDNNGSYGSFDDGSGNPTTCPLPGATGSAVFYNVTVENAIAVAVHDSVGGRSFCYSTPTSYAIAVSRPAAVVPTKSYFWCADSDGLKCGNDGNSGDGATPIKDGVCVPCTSY